MRSKFHNKRVFSDGVWFDSMAEERRYQELKLLSMAGEIENLVCHPVFLIIPKFTYRGKKYRATHYEADFSYTENGCKVVEDVKSKGTVTQVFKIKSKLFMMRYPSIDFRVIMR